MPPVERGRIRWRGPQLRVSRKERIDVVDGQQIQIHLHGDVVVLDRNEIVGERTMHVCLPRFGGDIRVRPLNDSVPIDTGDVGEQNHVAVKLAWTSQMFEPYVQRVFKCRDWLRWCARPSIQMGEDQFRHSFGVLPADAQRHEGKSPSNNAPEECGARLHVSRVFSRASRTLPMSCSFVYRNLLNSFSMCPVEVADVGHS